MRRRLLEDHMGDTTISEIDLWVREMEAGQFVL